MLSEQTKFVFETLYRLLAYAKLQIAAEPRMGPTAGLRHRET